MIFKKSVSKKCMWKFLKILSYQKKNGVCMYVPAAPRGSAQPEKFASHWQNQKCSNQQLYVH